MSETALKEIDKEIEFAKLCLVEAIQLNDLAGMRKCGLRQYELEVEKTRIMSDLGKRCFTQGLSSVLPPYYFTL
jgi:hypothetical protein